MGLSLKRITSSIGLDVGSSSVITTGDATVGLDILPCDEDTGEGAAGAGAVVVVLDAVLGAAAETGVGAAPYTGGIGVAAAAGDAIVSLAASVGAARTPRFVHTAGIAEHWTYTTPGHSPSSTASLVHVKELKAGKLAGQDGGIISVSDASYSERLNSELVSTALYLAANVSNWGNASKTQGMSMSSHSCGVM